MLMRKRPAAPLTGGRNGRSVARFALAGMLTATLVAANVHGGASTDAQGMARRALAPIAGAATGPIGQSTLLGATDPMQQISLAISVRGRNAGDLDAFAQAVNDPASVLYRQYLTPDEYTARFGPDPRDLVAALAFLRGAGLRVDQVYSGGQLITLHASVGQAEQAFHVQLHTYRAPAGYTFVRPDSAPQVPATLAGVITGVSGFDTSARPHFKPLPKPAHAPARAPLPQTGPASNSGGYTPYQLRTAYDVNPLISGGQDGTNRTIDVFEFDGFKQSNINTFDSYYGLTPPAPVVKLISGGVSTLSSGQSEVELDIEVLQGIAPKVHLNVYEATISTLSSFYSAFATEAQAMATARDASVASASWGWCETDWDSAARTQADNAFKQMTTEGMDTFISSGDDGSLADCTVGHPSENWYYTAQYPASDPYVTTVGGTALNLNSNDTYASESIWNDSDFWFGSGHIGAGGGGLSAVFAQPSYQQGPGVANSFSNGKREEPDVSADAAPETGYDIYTDDGSGTGTNAWAEYGGTSAAAPLFAAITELGDEYAIKQGKPSNGFVNAALYNLAASKPSAPAFPPFHDVTSGDNDAGPGPYGVAHNPVWYPATTAYDLASGLGSPDAYNIARDLAGGGSTPPPPAGTTIQVHGRTYSFKVNTAFSGFIGTFTDPKSGTTTSSYSTFVDWGDGLSGASGGVAVANGLFYIAGQHTYTRAGMYIINVTISANDGRSAYLTSLAVVN